MDLDLERWRRLRRAAANAVDDGPTFVQVQEANDRLARVRADLVDFNSKGPQGRVTGPPIVRGIVGVGGTTREDIQKAFDASVRELQSRVEEAKREADRLAERHRECSARRNALRRIVEDVRRWAAEQTPPITLPGDEGQFEPPPGIPGPSVRVQGPPPGSRDFLGRIAS